MEFNTLQTALVRNIKQELWSGPGEPGALASRTQSLQSTVPEGALLSLAASVGQGLSVCEVLLGTSVLFVTL